MIIGSGDIASAIEDRPGAVFFASGVSNSACSDPREFLREKQLLLEQSKDLCCFYFSSIAVERTSTPYLRHKLAMEDLVKSHFKHYNILRIGNIDFGSNPNTWLNWFKGQPKKLRPLFIKHEIRYLITKKDLRSLCRSLPLTGARTLAVYSESGFVSDLLKQRKLI